MNQFANFEVLSEDQLLTLKGGGDLIVTDDIDGF